MTNLENRQSYTSQKSAAATQSLHDDIRVKWNKLSDFEIGHLTGADDLIARVACLYTLDREHARGVVPALLNGRAI